MVPSCGLRQVVPEHAAAEPWLPRMVNRTFPGRDWPLIVAIAGTVAPGASYAGVLIVSRTPDGARTARTDWPRGFWATTTGCGVGVGGAARSGTWAPGSVGLAPQADTSAKSSATVRRPQAARRTRTVTVRHAP